VILSQDLASVSAVNAATGQVLSIRRGRTTVHKLWHFAGSKRRCLLMTGKDGEMFMTKSFNVSPKTTEHHVIARSDKSVAYVTNNKRLCSTFCTIEANYWQTRSIAPPLCDSRATCCHCFIWSVIVLVTRRRLQAKGDYCFWTRHVWVCLWFCLSARHAKWSDLLQVAYKTQYSSSGMGILAVLALQIFLLFLFLLTVVCQYCYIAVISRWKITGKIRKYCRANT